MTEIDRQVRLDASPSDVAAALATSPWRSAMRIEPAGAGSRVVISARAEPDELARAVENMALDEVCRLRSALSDPPPRTAPLGEGSWRRTVQALEMQGGQMPGEGGGGEGLDPEQLAEMLFQALLKGFDFQVHASPVNPGLRFELVEDG